MGFIFWILFFFLYLHAQECALFVGGSDDTFARFLGTWTFYFLFLAMYRVLGTILCLYNSFFLLSRTLLPTMWWWGIYFIDCEVILIDSIWFTFVSVLTRSWTQVSRGPHNTFTSGRATLVAGFPIMCSRQQKKSSLQPTAKKISPCGSDCRMHQTIFLMSAALDSQWARVGFTRILSTIWVPTSSFRCWPIDKMLLSEWVLHKYSYSHFTTNLILRLAKLLQVILIT